MRIIVDLATHQILQVEGSPPLGDPVAINGKYVIPIPDGASVDVNASSYVLNAGVVDSGSIVTEAFSGLLAQFPMFDNILFNPLITADHAADLDPTIAFPDPPNPSLPTRAQFGRGSVDPQEGLSPNSVAVYPLNDKVTPSRPGMLITDTIDISLPPPDGASVAGALEFMVWWQIYKFQTTEDIASDLGATAGQNEPAIRSILEVDQELSGFQVYISVNDGGTYFPISRLEPIVFCEQANQIRIAFENQTNEKIYLASYALLF